MMMLDRFMSLEFLDAANNKGYGPLPIPMARDNEINDMLREWAALDEHERNEAAKKFSFESCVQTLECYSSRMASLAVRTGDPEFIYLGLLALGVFGWLPPWGIRVEYVTLHYDASKRIGVQSEDVFEKAARLLVGKVADELRLYLRRPPHLKTIDCMHFYTSMVGDGFRYKKYIDGFRRIKSYEDSDQGNSPKN
jgi:hypothetical protein